MMRRLQNDINRALNEIAKTKPTKTLSEYLQLKGATTPQKRAFCTGDYLQQFHPNPDQKFEYSPHANATYCIPLTSLPYILHQITMKWGGPRQFKNQSKPAAKPKKQASKRPQPKPAVKQQSSRLRVILDLSKAS